ncbi:uncharacterized protein LTR77_010668 [Saxophila tyrrhenica]|uniref:Uncharacterized protein n=1 Tax=Saxophila tyrrhenica TaxID=1690608 RepID=A0AAV9NXE2_9PEZI|nr:hypothetical protein LTR77_010668 [Saxophila tyrrhenica]
MEQHDPPRRQYATQAFTAQQPQPALAPTSGQYAAPGGTERFRQSAYLQESPSTPPSAIRGGSDAQTAYGYAPVAQYGAASAMQPTALQYGQEMQTPESQRQQSQPYPHYGSHTMYGMAQPHGAQSPYDPITQYRSRTNTASETLGSQFGVPQNAQYYLAGQPSQPNTSAPQMPSHHLPSQYEQPETYPQPGSSNTQPYGAAMIDPSHGAQYQNYVQQQPQPQYQQIQQQPTLDQGFDRYNDQIRTIFILARDGALRDVGGHLLDVSSYLIGNAEQLGLTRDDENLHGDRLRLWEEFNRAWLVALQRQFDMTEEMVQTSYQPREPQSLMSAASLTRLGDELARLCDSVEKHGLVDYQLGVAEDEIMDLLIRCLISLEPTDPLYAQGGPYNLPSASSTTRRR